MIIEYFPSISVTVPNVVSETLIMTPIMGSLFSSITVPVTVLFACKLFCSIGRGVAFIINGTISNNSSGKG
ncbi:hypothetical protein CLV62_10989 [Dysgonomonas alginatilytica]|uniref:Uncharacterized protein n=1 Tax=Dysgonomonas alginatilytica TaxID=1605892 RepID=A0A2V3PRY5_9BACT|nr:hypothetical protein CLV62_10989 [Dysgonomonas alginatilytica]